jgi:hypothetical protein
MKVYLVTHCGEVDGVFSTPAKAREFLAREVEEKDRAWYLITEREVDYE